MAVYERTCQQPDAPARLCVDEFQNQIQNLKRAGRTPDTEEVCDHNARLFDEMQAARQARNKSTPR